MQVPTFILCADPSPLGRLDYASLPQQTLMEMLIERVENRQVILKTKRKIKSIVHWTGIECDADGNLIRITWPNWVLGGSVDLQWLPSTVKEVEFRKNSLGGSMPFESFPDSLETLIITDNRFSGTIALDRAPSNMITIHIWNNALSGSLNLEKLPPSLLLLILRKNKFEGTVCLTKLPKEMKSVSLAFNMLSGSLDLTALPAHLIYLRLEENRFVGEVDFSKLPKKLHSVSVGGNTELSGECSANTCNEILFEKTNIKYLRE